MIQAKYEFIPDSGHHICDVMVDGVSKGKLSEYEFTNFFIAINKTDRCFLLRCYGITY